MVFYELFIVHEKKGRYKNKVELKNAAGELIVAKLLAISSDEII